MPTDTRLRGFGFVGLCLAWTISIGTVGGREAPTPGEGPPGSAQGPVTLQEKVVPVATCVNCHDQSTERPRAYHGQCQTCHTNGAAHADDPDVGKIGALTAGQCLSCHVAMKTKWSFGPHEKADVGCASCHTVHASATATGIEVRAKRMDRESTTCASCHTDTMARFRLPSHHPVTEGAMSCTSCHDPHSAAWNSVRSETELCGSCHQAQRTPKAVLHPPVAEGCSSCHTPHGSPNRRLLAMAQPGLCIQCHSIADNRHAVGSAARGAMSGAVLRGCVGCHKAIHGTQTDPHLRF